LKTLHYKHATENPTQNAHQHCLDVESSTGLSLMNHDSNNPNEVHGYMNMSSDGTVEIHLYEQADIDAILALPLYIETVVEREVLGVKSREIKRHERRNKDVELRACAYDKALEEKVHRAMTDKGFVIQTEGE
jgi:hypothetical protein